MSATVAAALKKIAIYILGDEKKRGKLFILIGSIAVGFIGLMCLPVAVLSSMGSMEIEPPEIYKSLFNESAIMAGLSNEQQEQITDLQNQGQAIEDAMTNAGVRFQTIKAQLIYMSYFDGVQNFNAESYANLFAAAPNDNDLVAAINSTYDLDINYDEFMRTYTWVMNSTINEYMFSDESTKNCADLAAWAENAYVSGWGYMNGFIGERNESDRIRYADNAGLMLGYLNYNPTDKVFNSNYDTLVYTEQGGLDTMPEVAGIGLFDGSQHGIYVGNGKVIYSSESVGYVTKDLVSNGSWSSWCTYEGVDYPPEVTETQYSTEIAFEEYDPAVKKNLDLVQWAIQAYESGWGYVYGTYGNVLTEELLQDRAAVFGGQVTDYMDFIRTNWMGKRTSDCVGLIKGYGWYDSASGEIVVGSNGMTDVSANGMFEAAAVKGTIDTLPEVPGLAVWHEGHIGIYIGNGEVIEAMNTERGMTRTELAGRSWTHWLQIPYISYIENQGE